MSRSTDNPHGGNRKHTNEERGDDEYQTPPEALIALMGVEALPQVMWEPACGEGNLVNVIRESGRSCWASDKHETPCEYSYVSDFLGTPIMGRPQFLIDNEVKIGGIITNPPFLLIEEFIDRALTLAPLVYMLGPSTFMHGVDGRVRNSGTRTRLIEKSGLRTIWAFRDRLPMMHRKGWEESGKPTASSQANHCWYVWQRGWTGKRSLNRLSWRDPKPMLAPPIPKTPKTYDRHTIDMFDGLNVGTESVE